MSSLTSDQIKAHARVLGFDGCGVAPATDLPELAFFAEWLARGYAATMSWLERTAEKRMDVRRVLPSAQSVIVTATNYNTARPYSTEPGESERVHIARYAWGDDYHVVLAERQERLVEWMREQAGEPFEALSYVDTGPVQERVFAQHAGIGWIGKNCCVINESIGSFLFLGAVVTSLSLEPDMPAFEQCGGCTLCLESCPTQALVAPGELDSNRCISYLTIEHRGDLPQDLQPAIGAHLYGCDICQEVCPWNSLAPASADAAWQPRPAWDQPRLSALEQMDDDHLRAALRGSAMKRTKLAGLRRNLRVVRSNVDAESSSRRDDPPRPDGAAV